MSAAGVVTRPRGSELPVVRVELDRTPGLGRSRGAVLRAPHDAARVLAPFVDGASPTHRLALALLDARRRLLGVALLDGGEWRACCLRPSEVFEPALVAGAAGLYLAHRHPRAGLWVQSADCASLSDVCAMGIALGVQVHDHLIFDARGSYAGLIESQDAWSHGHFASLLERRVLPACQPLRRVSKGAGPHSRMVMSSPAPSRHSWLHPARPPLFRLVGLRARLLYDEAPLALACRPLVHTHRDVALALGDVLGRQGGAVVAGLINPARRLFAVAVIRAAGADGCACQTVSPQALYRAAIAGGAHAVFLAHQHAAMEDTSCDAARDWTARAYALGRELGLELRDHLLFNARGGYLSLRELRQGVQDWCGDADLAATPYGLRLHQAMSNRRPQRPALTRSLSARAALQACGACGRRSLIKAACPWCGVPRPLPVTQGDDRAA